MSFMTKVALWGVGILALALVAWVVAVKVIWFAVSAAVVIGACVLLFRWIFGKGGEKKA